MLAVRRFAFSYKLLKTKLCVRNTKVGFLTEFVGSMKATQAGFCLTIAKRIGRFLVATSELTGFAPMNANA